MRPGLAIFWSRQKGSHSTPSTDTPRYTTKITICSLKGSTPEPKKMDTEWSLIQVESCMKGTSGMTSMTDGARRPTILESSGTASMTDMECTHRVRSTTKVSLPVAYSMDKGYILREKA